MKAGCFFISPRARHLCQRGTWAMSCNRHHVRLLGLTFWVAGCTTKGSSNDNASIGRFADTSGRRSQTHHPHGRLGACAQVSVVVDRQDARDRRVCVVSPAVNTPAASAAGLFPNLAARVESVRGRQVEAGCSQLRDKPACTEMTVCAPSAATSSLASLSGGSQ